MSWLFNDDICWCGNSNECDITECFRHLSNRRPQPKPDIYTMANFMGNIDCPYFQRYKTFEEKINGR